MCQATCAASKQAISIVSAQLSEESVLAAHQCACSIGQLLRTGQTRTSSKTIDHKMNEKRRRAYVGRSSVDVSPRCTTHLLNSTMGYNVPTTLYSIISNEQTISSLVMR
jgi:hypothetical protein